MHAGGTTHLIPHGQWGTTGSGTAGTHCKSYFIPTGMQGTSTRPDIGRIELALWKCYWKLKGQQVINIEGPQNIVTAHRWARLLEYQIFAQEQHQVVKKSDRAAQRLLQLPNVTK